MKKYFFFIFLYIISCGKNKEIKYIHSYRIPPEIIRISSPDSFLYEIEDISRGELAYILTTRVKSYGILNILPLENENIPNDINNFWARDKIIIAVNYKLMKKMPDQNFYPNDPVKKFQFAMVLFRIKENIFFDRISANIFNESWEWAINNNFIIGDRNDYLSGEEAIDGIIKFCNYLLE